MQFLMGLIRETHLGLKCGCTCKKCIPGPHYFHCGNKLRLCFERPK